MSKSPNHHTNPEKEPPAPPPRRPPAQTSQNTGTTIQVWTEAITDPKSSAKYHQPERIYDDAYSSTIDSYIQTLSGGTANLDDLLTGLLYVPTLDDGDPCIDQSSEWVPKNVTRKSDLPKSNEQTYIAIAPWVRGHSECGLSYLNAARVDGVQAFIFFLSGDSSDPPPGPEGTIWLQGSNPNKETDQWMDANDYPVFAIPSDAGNELMEELAKYSGSIGQVPHGETLEKHYDANDFVRLEAGIAAGVASNLPSLWILLLVVLAIVMTLMGLTSLSLHWLQLRRRRDLRRRVESGEVDLEALGIKRLTVPQEVLDDMPLYTYGSGEPAKLSTTTATTETKPATTTDKTESIKGARAIPTVRTNSSWPAPYVPPPASDLAKAPSHIPTALLQPTCPICLEEFIPANTVTSTPGTTVRELPCQHIFHPECVDTFLTSTSSLCPMCKTAALPKGYCPKLITNAMVRRERIVRRRGTLAAMRADAELPYVTGQVSPLRRSRVVSWGVGVSTLSPYQGRQRTTPRATVPRIFRSPSSPAVPAIDGTEMTTVVPPPRLALMRAMSTPAVAGAPPNTLTRSMSTSAVPTVAEGDEDGQQEGEGTTVQPSSNPRRREWARQRAVAMLGRQDVPIDPDAEEAARMPRWRKGLSRVFPGLAR